ncbi:MAG: DUF3859 domain-containing protein [Bacteroidales bacterium]|nr:DUF3859 domain-containing protein [Bacteroidales bacterium]MBN2818974.1 DUF3859 domain-containing protein [Bacteroidales bacterium]
MSILRPQIKIESFGIFSSWDRNSKDLPRVEEFTEEIPAIEGKEFGMILHITGGKGIKLDFCIKHPPFKDSKGIVEPDFTGVYHVSTNDYKFYLGDCIWLPVEDKAGIWHLIVEWKGKIIAEKKFNIILS